MEIASVMKVRDGWFVRGKEEESALRFRCK